MRTSLFTPPLESIRLVVFHEALQDIRTLELLESFLGKEKTLQLIEKDGFLLTVTGYPRKSGYILQLREKVSTEIEKYLQQVRE